MSARLRRLPLLSRLRSETSGLAMVEFAVSLPVLMVLGLVGLEVANYAMAHMRIGEIAMLTADNAGRVRDSIDEINVNEIMHGAKLMGQTIDFAAHGRIILSSMENNSAGTGQWIRWQRCAGAKQISSSYGTQGKGQNNNSLPGMGPPTNRISAMSGTAVMFVEVVYDYQPIVAGSVLGNKQIRYESAFNVRQRTDQAIKNAKNLPSSQTSSCSTYSA